MVRTWDGLGDRGESNDRGPSSYKTRSSQLSSEADISNPATVKFKSGHKGLNPASTRGGLVHSESATRSRDLVPATGNKVAHAITEREAPEAREAGDQNNCCKVRH